MMQPAITNIVFNPQTGQYLYYNQRTRQYLPYHPPQLPQVQLGPRPQQFPYPAQPFYPQQRPQQLPYPAQLNQSQQPQQRPQQLPYPAQLSQSQQPQQLPYPAQLSQPQQLPYPAQLSQSQQPQPRPQQHSSLQGGKLPATSDQQQLYQKQTRQESSHSRSPRQRTPETKPQHSSQHNVQHGQAAVSNKFQHAKPHPANIQSSTDSVKSATRVEARAPHGRTNDTRKESKSASRDSSPRVESGRPKQKQATHSSKTASPLPYPVNSDQGPSTFSDSLLDSSKKSDSDNATTRQTHTSEIEATRRPSVEPTVPITEVRESSSPMPLATSEDETLGLHYDEPPSSLAMCLNSLWVSSLCTPSGPANLNKGIANLSKGSSSSSVLPLEARRIVNGPQSLNAGPAKLAKGPSVITSGPNQQLQGPAGISKGPAGISKGSSLDTIGPSSSAISRRVVSPTGPSHDTLLGASLAVGSRNAARGPSCCVRGSIRNFDKIAETEIVAG
ncbi:formin-J-like isoform X2 [Hyalella azteca]|uniref:Formin-J-like isoform X2 n=1 Tax=Hyalella azteca TaxID=294128 RepID=A0A8B7PIF5_HYAAZ|nr:formin-J-like isoform X2 [Hyalella azteca]